MEHWLLFDLYMYFCYDGTHEQMHKYLVTIFFFLFNIQNTKKELWTYTPPQFPVNVNMTMQFSVCQNTDDNTYHVSLCNIALFKVKFCNITNILFPFGEMENECSEIHFRVIRRKLLLNQHIQTQKVKIIIIIKRKKKDLLKSY